MLSNHLEESHNFRVIERNRSKYKHPQAHTRRPHVSHICRISLSGLYGAHLRTVEAVCSLSVAHGTSALGPRQRHQRNRRLLLVAVEIRRHAKVTQFQIAVEVHQQILRL
jgi:hypothetical protein